jgi:cell division septal protein FtsQ
VRTYASATRTDRRFKVRKPPLSAVTVKQRKRWLRWTLRTALASGSFIGVAVLAQAGWGLLRSDSAFSVRHIQVIGLVHHESSPLSDALRDLGGHNLFILRPHEVAERLGGFPWLRGFLCRKHLPDTLIVEVQERPALCAVATPEGIFELDGSGMSWPALPGVQGVFTLGRELERNAADTQGLVAELLSLGLAGQVVSVEKAETPRAYVLVTRDGWRLVAAARDLETQWKRFEAARNWSAMYLKERRTMDLRWNGKVVLAPPPAPESETPAPGGEAVAPGPGEGGPTHG